MFFLVSIIVNYFLVVTKIHISIIQIVLAKEHLVAHVNKLWTPASAHKVALQEEVNATQER